jgi:ribosomal protein S18 acetylase RimI-like enzyme
LLGPVGLHRPTALQKIVGHLNAVNIVNFDSARTDELVRLWRESFEFGVGVVDPHPISDQRDHFVNTVVPNNAVRMALLCDQLVGFIAATKESITHLYVRVGHHRCGVGTKLLAWAKGQSSGSLWLYAFARNATARAFYEKHGFVIIARGFEPTWQLDDIKYEWAAQHASV